MADELQILQGDSARATAVLLLRTKFEPWMEDIRARIKANPKRWIEGAKWDPCAACRGEGFVARLRRQYISTYAKPGAPKYGQQPEAHELQSEKCPECKGKRIVPGKPLSNLVLNARYLLREHGLDEAKLGVEKLSDIVVPLLEEAAAADTGT